MFAVPSVQVTQSTMVCQEKSAQDAQTLLPMSPYCELHKPTVAVPPVEDVQESTTATPVHSEDQVGLIIGKRVTRNTTMYHVRIKSYFANTSTVDQLVEKTMLTLSTLQTLIFELKLSRC